MLDSLRVREPAVVHASHHVAGEVTGGLGIIDTLTAGFNAVGRRIWLTAIPIVLDLFLWLGPKLSMSPVIDRLLGVFESVLEAASPQTQSEVALAEMLRASMDMMQETLGRTNLFALLAWGRLGVPSIAGANLIDADARWVVQMSEYWQVLLVQSLVLGLGLLIACAFLVQLAQQSLEEKVDSRELPRRVLASWASMLVIFVPLGLVFMFSLSISLLFGPFAIFIGVIMLWIVLYISFVPQAITLGEKNPLRALWSSFMVVRHNFWSALGMILLVNTINTGLGFIWIRLLMQSTVGTVIAILANAYVGTSLSLAMFVFYRDRVGTWSPSLPQPRSA